MKRFILVALAFFCTGCDYIGDKGAARKALKKELGTSSSIELKDVEERSFANETPYICGRYKVDNGYEFEFTRFVYSPGRDEVVIFNREKRGANRLATSLLVAQMCR